MSEAPGSPDRWSLGLSHGPWVWFVVTVGVEKGTSHIGVGIISY